MDTRAEHRALTDVIRVCRDAERGFRCAADHVRTPAVKALFLDIAAQRATFAEEVLARVRHLGGGADRGGSVAGALHRGWMTVRDAMEGHDEATVILEAERGERAALAAYRKALDTLSPAARPIVERQYEDVRRSHHRVRALHIM